MSGAIRATHEPSLATRLGPSGECHGYGEWVEALCVFYERDCLPQKAANLRNGAPLDYVDRRTIDALKAAFKVAA